MSTLREKNGAAQPPRSEIAPGGSLGTFAGVFTPSVLTILGIILFLRLGFVVGSAGLVRALVIIGMANLISVLTSISLSAIATNLRVRGGGDYYLISRTLGVEFGGALGLVLFLAQSLSIAFYAIGFGEAVAAIVGSPTPRLPQAIAAIAVAGLFVLAWMGADVATRFQYVVMAVLFAALVAFFLGGIPAFDTGQLRENLHPAGDLPFWVIFAIFFPAVTGFTQGVSMSGDLRDPGKSLPRGTFLAVGLSAIVYIGVAVVFAGVVPGSDLVSDYGSMRRVSRVAWLVDAGVIAATLSSALASFLGAPRILQSLATDRVFPLLHPFAAGHGPTANPRRGVLLSTVIAFGAIGLGDLNVIAPVVSMFFLISYGLLNYATYVEARSNSPSFRPRFRFFHARLSLLGCLGCLGAMLAIQPTAGAVAVAVLFALHQYLSRSVEVNRWAAGGRSRRLQRVREDLHSVSSTLEHPRDWRPVILAFSDDPQRRGRLLRFAGWLEGRSGFTTLVRLVEGDDIGARRRLAETESELRREIDRLGVPVFARAVLASNVEDAMPVLVQSHGLGPVRPNTVLINWYDRSPDTDSAPGLRSYGRYVRQSLRHGCNVVLLGATSQDLIALEDTVRSKRRIDVWYRDNASGRLMLLLAYLMTRSEEWEDARIRLLASPPEESTVGDFEEGLRGMIDEVRIAAEPVIVQRTDAATVIEHSAGSSVVFLPFRTKDDVPTSVTDEPLDGMVRALGITAMVLACQDIALNAAPEEGRHAEIADAVDAAEHTLKVASRAEKESAHAAELAVKARAKLEAESARGVGEEELRPLREAADLAVQEAEKLRRRAARVRTKADSAAEEADGLTSDSSADAPVDKGS